MFYRNLLQMNYPGQFVDVDPEQSAWTDGVSGAPVKRSNMLAPRRSRVTFNRIVLSIVNSPPCDMEAHCVWRAWVRRPLMRCTRALAFVKEQAGSQIPLSYKPTK